MLKIKSVYRLFEVKISLIHIYIIAIYSSKAMTRNHHKLVISFILNLCISLDMEITVMISFIFIISLLTNLDLFFKMISISKLFNQTCEFPKIVTDKLFSNRFNPLNTDF